MYEGEGEGVCEGEGKCVRGRRRRRGRHSMRVCVCAVKHMSRSVLCQESPYLSIYVHLDLDLSPSLFTSISISGLDLPLSL